MTTPPALAHPPSPSLDPAPPADELSLAALLELFAPDDSSVAPEQPSLRAAGVRLHSWTQQTSRRAAAWGAVGSESTGGR